MPILGCVIGEEFAAVLAAAQDGSEAAFSALWRGANPALPRYLRVAAPDASEKAVRAFVLALPAAQWVEEA